MNQSMSYRISSNISSLTWLVGAALLIMASDRLAHAIVVTGALVWVYSLSTLAIHAGAKNIPLQIRPVLIAFVVSFIAGLYLLLFWMLSPLCALQTFFVISFVPVVCMVSGIFNRLKDLSLSDTFYTSCSEALIVGSLIICFAIVREPLGFGSLSLPGGAQGIVLLFSFPADSFLPIRIIASSSGGLLLLGYSLGMYRYFKSANAQEEK